MTGRSIKHFFPIIVFLVMMEGYMCGCSGSGGANSDSDSVSKLHEDDSHRLPDTLRAVTLYSPMSYFHYRDEVMGYDYNLLIEFAESRNLELDLTIAPSLNRAVQMLDSGLVDLIAYEVPVTSEYRQSMSPCGPEWRNSQVLIQRTDSEKPVKDVTELVGRTVWVERDSKYFHRLENLNQELGGGIDIKTIELDTLITEDAIGMVARGEIELTVVDSDIARVNKTYYNGIDATVELSFGQRSRWAVRNDQFWLGDSITVWFNSTATQTRNETLLKQYFQKAKTLPPSDLDLIDFSSGKISPYDNLFKKYAKEIGWDWRLLAAQGWVESHFKNDVVSWAGARGIMQIMPSTARLFGASPETLTNPETSIEVATKLLKALDDVLKRKISDPVERRKFVTAAYNSGEAHIIDAISLARKYNRNPEIWSGNVSEALMMKSDSRYYTDPVVKYGYFRGQQTTAYVKQVYDFYERAKKHISE